MDIAQLLQTNIRQILDTARLAPSVHNTQPWQVQVDGNSLVISLDPRHVLHDGDPTGRETTISLGIFCEAIQLSSQPFGIQATKTQLDKDSVRLEFGPNQAQTDAEHRLTLLRRRCSDRSLYNPVPISDELQQTFIAVSKSPTITVHVVTNNTALATIASLTSKGIALALSSPGFRRELSHYLTVPWSGFKRGISTSSLALAWPIAVLQPLFIRLGWQTGAEAAFEKRRWESASAAVAITADGDMPDYWFEAGQVYLRLSLAIEDAGLSQATSAATVEASNYHDDIEEILGTNQRVLAMIRIGQGSKRRHHSPRVSVDELLH